MTVAGIATEPQTLATALRDLAVCANNFVQTPNDRNRHRLNHVSNYVEMLLDQFVAQEGDVHPQYLSGWQPFYALGESQ